MTNRISAPATFGIEYRSKKTGHTFLFKFTLETRSLMLFELTCMARDPEVPFVWVDAAFVSKAIRGLAVHGN